MSTECSNCLGTGIVGQGDQPWLHTGRQDVCGKCGGTGQIPAEIAPNEAQPEPVNTPDEIPVDNSNLTEAPSASDLSSVDSVSSDVGGAVSPDASAEVPAELVAPDAPVAPLE